MMDVVSESALPFIPSLTSQRPDSQRPLNQEAYSSMKGHCTLWARLLPQAEIEALRREREEKAG